MKTTKNLKLPQYTGEDIFDLQDINKAYDSIDKAYGDIDDTRKEVVNIKDEIPKTNATAEVISARGSKETLGKRLDEFGSQLDTKTNLSNKRISVMNETTDNEGVIDLVNFSGQGTAHKDIMAKIHNYTDSDVMWLDNVGETNTILRLNNSRNPVRRLDKGENYVGNGKYLVCGKHKEDGSIYYVLLEIDENMNFNFNNAGAIEFVNNKLNSDGEPAFIIKTPSGLHKHLLKLQTASDNTDVFILGCHPSGSIAQIEIGEKMTSGLNIVFSNIDETQHLKFGTADNPYTVPNVIVKPFAPTAITPHFIGQMFVNTIDKSVYMATEVVVGGWTKLSN